jgi:3D (Asp-Asp-Asp) domain-containing protein
MAKQVAVVGEVLAMPGTIPYPPATSGAWMAMPVQYSTDRKLTVGGRATIYAAECRFMFTGAAANGAPVNGQETVQLRAKSTKVRSAGPNVLVMGDSGNGAYGNKLQVVATNKLMTD